MGLIDPAFWRGRRVLVTGHTGFKGGWLALWLARMGARVTGIALPPPTHPSLFELAGVASLVDSVSCDVRDLEPLRARVQAAAPEVVFHLAAQPLVRRAYREPVETFATNVMGTVHLLESLRGVAGLRAAVMVTTDKVYRNREWVHPYRETDELGGHDPYSASKAASELAIATWRDALLPGGAPVASARAGNVIGGGDWSEDRLLPDAVRAWSRGEALEIRRPQATRPWQHVLEPLAGYLVLAQRLAAEPAAFAGAWNFGPASDELRSVREVVAAAAGHWPGAQVRFAPAAEGPHEAGWLALDTARTRHLLGLQPRWSTAEAVARSIAWYRDVADGADARARCHADIDDYEARAA